MYYETNNCYILSTTSHKDLSLNLSKYTNIKILNTKIEYFANNEIRTSISSSVRGKNLFIITSPHNNNSKSINDYIMETYLLIKTCKRSDSGNITLICPCYPYARQDKKDNSRTCISARDIADLFTNAGIDRIVSLDLHSAQIQGFFNIPCDNFYCINMIYDYLVNNHDINKEFDNKLNTKFVIVAPDEGALKRVQVYANKFKMPFMVVSKERDYSKVNNVERAVLIGDKKYLEGRTAIIIDDMLDTGGTVIKVGELLMSKGAKDVMVIVTHGILSDPAIERINKTDYLKEVVVSNSLPQEEKKNRCPKLKTFSIVPMLSEVIIKLCKGGSLSQIFEN
jgi:ribose-phosphate pyrophosphokinase